MLCLAWCAVLEGRRLPWLVAALIAVLAACGTGPAQLPSQGPGGEARYAPESPADPVLAPVLDGATPQAASDPAALAHQLVVSETAIRDPQTSPEALRAAAWTAQVAYRTLEHRPRWDAAVFDAVPARLDEVVGRNLAARREFQSMEGRLGTMLPAWKMVEPLPAAQLRDLYGEAQQRFGVPWQILAAVQLVETGMGRIVGLSSAGAQGPMQFMPATWDAYGMGGDVWNTRDAVMGAANYLAANGADEGRLDHALFHYNRDMRYVRAVRHYASVMRLDERAFLGYHARPVYYRTAAGDILLPTGYESRRSIPVQEYLARPPR